jgi:HAD superfamily hydrolase (TIGR01509 family)
VIKALLFDFDGVIADTEVAPYESWRETYAEYGVDLALPDWLPAVGTGSSTSGVFDAVAHLETLIGATVDREAVIARRAQRMAELYAQAPLLPGVRERLAEAQERGLKTAIVTRNYEDRVKAHCELVDLDHRWDEHICANDQPTRDKAEMYRYAVAVLGVSVDQALAFEDSPSGVRAAKVAGVFCAAVPNDVTRAARFAEADIVLSSLGGQSLDAILRAVARGRARQDSRTGVARRAPAREP